MPAERGALRGHSRDRCAPGLVHGLHERPVPAHRAATGCHRDAGVGHSAECAEPAVSAAVRRAPVTAGVTDVVDGGAEHLAHRLESGALDGSKLVGGQRRSPRPALPDLCHPGFGGRRQAATGIDGHSAPPCRAVHRSPHDTRRAGAAALAVVPVVARLAGPTVLGFPFLIATPDRLQCVLRRLAGRIRPEPVLARAAGPLLHLMVPQAEPPALVVVHVPYNSRSCLLPSSPAGSPRSAPCPRISPGPSTSGGARRESASRR